MKIVINMIQAYFSLPEKDNTVETTKPFPLFPSPRQVAEEWHNRSMVKRHGIARGQRKKKQANKRTTGHGHQRTCWNLLILLAVFGMFLVDYP